MIRLAIVSTPLRILAIGAHPDDLEILCGGTLAKYAAQGYSITMAIATDGSAGSTDFSSNELKEIRKLEAEESAKIIHARSIWMDEPDEQLFETKETRFKIMDVIRAARPDLIITHSPIDYHPDHQVTSNAVLNASFISSLPNIKGKFEAHSLIPPIYYMDTLAGVNFQPDEYVDISNQFETKKRMLSCHKSQIKWLKDHNDIDVLEFIEIVARFRGYQAGIKYAEGFQRAPYWLRITPTRLLP